MYFQNDDIRIVLNNSIDINSNMLLKCELKTAKLLTDVSPRCNSAIYGGDGRLKICFGFSHDFRVMVPKLKKINVMQIYQG